MDDRGWNQEFRTMSGNILIQKKLERDLGLSRNLGAHLRTNLREIIAVEHLFESEKWLENPSERIPIFRNLDKSVILDENLIQFWVMCGQNRDSGVAAILKNKPVTFKNVKATKDELDDSEKDLQGLKNDIEELISSKPVGDILRNHFEATFKENISKSSDLNEVEDFYWLVSSQYSVVNDTELDESLEEDTEALD